MFQYKNYPIYVVYSMQRQRQVRRLNNSYLADRDNAMEVVAKRIFHGQFSRVGRALEVFNKKARQLDAIFEWHITEDMPAADIAYFNSELYYYENELQQQLTTIFASPVGRLLLDSINPNETIWIIPIFRDGPKAYNAKASPYTLEQGGGIRIEYNPNEFSGCYINANLSRDCRGEVLFHELVHASRFSNKTFSSVGLYGYLDQSSEEFIATNLTNVYLSMKGIKELNMTNMGGYLSKRGIYEGIERNDSIINLIEQLLSSDRLVQQIARMKNVSFNPFRDLDLIKSGDRKRFDDIYVPS